MSNSSNNDPPEYNMSQDAVVEAMKKAWKFACSGWKNFPMAKWEEIAEDPSMVACARGNLRKLNKFYDSSIEKGFDPNWLLEVAVKHDQPKIVKFLHEEKEVALTSELLRLATDNKQYEVAAYMAEKGVSTDSLSEKDQYNVRAYAIFARWNDDVSPPLDKIEAPEPPKPPEIG